MAGNSKSILLLLITALLFSGICGCSETSGNAAGNIAFSGSADKEAETENEAEASSLPEDEKVTESSPGGLGDTVSQNSINAAGTDGKDKAGLVKVPVPKLFSEEFDMSRYDEKDLYMYFECYGNSYLCSDETAEENPKLNTALNELDEAHRSFYQKEIDEHENSAHEFGAEAFRVGSKECFGRYSETTLENADEKVVSLCTIEYGYLGGAHPDYYYETFNINTATGEIILLSDLISDKEGLDRVLADKLKKQYPDGEFFDLEESLAGYSLDATPFDEEKTAYDFNMDPKGFTFCFDPYSLNSYAEGAQVIEVSYTEIPDLLKDGFLYDLKAAEKTKAGE